MQIYLNQESIDIQSLTISTMLTELNIQSNGIAVGVNNTVIPRSQWDAYILVENDKVIIISATQGG